MAKAKKKSGDELEITIPEVFTTQRIPVFQDESGTKEFPLLLSLLSPAYDDRGRTTWESARITLTVRSGYLRAIIACPSRQLQTLVTLGTAVDALAQIETALGSGELNWESTYDKIKEEKNAMKEAKKLMAKKP